MTRPLAVVTGASAGIGADLARRLAAGGFDLVLVARREAELRTLADGLTKAHGIAAEVIVADLSDPAAPPKLIATIPRPIDVLVNNAGFGWLGEFAESDPARMLAMVQVNVTALVHLTRLVLPGMRERKQGRILNVSRVAGFQPGPLMAVYYATKAFILSFSEAVHTELRGSGVTVTVLCPGPTTTEFADVSGMAATGLFDNAMSSVAVADAGYRGLMRGKRLVVPGIGNKLMTLAVRLIPRPVILRIVERIQSKRR
jgi:short-subunit dehydrogenase